MSLNILFEGADFYTKFLQRVIIWFNSFMMLPFVFLWLSEESRICRHNILGKKVHTASFCCIIAFECLHL